MMSTLTWVRHTEGFYQATAPNGDYYRVRREGSDVAASRRGWEIAVWRNGSTSAPPASPDVLRGRFSKLDLAKAGAEGTRCVRCNRPRMLGEMSHVVGTRRSSYPTYVCYSDKAECRRVQLENDAREAEDMREALTRQDHNEIEIRETEFGPDLVVGRSWVNEGTGMLNGSRDVLGLTENDLARIERVIHERRQDQAAKLRWSRQGPDRRYLSESTADELDKLTSLSFGLAGRWGWENLDLVRVVSSEGTYFMGRVTYLSAGDERVTVKLMGREQLPSKPE